MRRHVLVWSCAALFLGAASANLARAQGDGPGQGQGQEDQEVMTRGPVHEAFANPVVFNEQKGALVPKEPPPDVEELPPDQKPDGDVIWIGGYWQYDDDRNDFIWVSGIWRVAPPGLQWTPGYWNKGAGGSQWVSGYWNQVARREVDYLPEPPQTLEVGPSTPAPENEFWIPGTHIYRENRYVWRPGYYSVIQPNWIWVPAHYVRSPLGFVYVDGYWDHAFDRRGVVFAPVYFRNRHFRPNYYYSPTVVLQSDNLLLSFWARPSHRHYYFGDYYDVSYRNRGFRMWFDFDRRGGYRYDPLYTYYRGYSYRNDPQWDVHLRDHYRYLQVNATARPPRTFAAVNIRGNNNVTNINITNIKNFNNSNSNNFVMASSLSQIRAGAPSPMRLQQIDATAQRNLKAQVTAGRAVSRERATLEARALSSRPASGAGAANGRVEPIRLPSTTLGDRVANNARDNNRTDGRRDNNPGRVTDGRRDNNPGRVTDGRRDNNPGRVTDNGKTGRPTDNSKIGKTTDNNRVGKIVPSTAPGTERRSSDPAARTNPGTGAGTGAGNRADSNSGRPNRSNDPNNGGRNGNMEKPNNPPVDNGRRPGNTSSDSNTRKVPPIPRETNRGSGGTNNSGGVGGGERNKGGGNSGGDRGNRGGGNKGGDRDRGGKDRDRSTADVGAIVPNTPTRSVAADRESRRTDDKTGRVGRQGQDRTGGSADPSATRSPPPGTTSREKSDRPGRNRDKDRDDDKKRGG